jgi:L-2-hydroxyglutarate oxidase LhgO
MLQEAGVTVMLETDVRDVRKNGTKLEAVLLESQSETEWLEASFFIDASYEGALMQECGVVDYTFGREAASTYNESWG